MQFCNFLKKYFLQLFKNSLTSGRRRPYDVDPLNCSPRTEILVAPLQFYVLLFVHFVCIEAIFRSFDGTAMIVSEK